jgi:hypothetical protein
MKRAIATLLIATTMATSVPAWADPPAPAAPPPAATVTTPDAAPTPPPIIYPLNKGQPSPLTGVLFSPEAVAQIIAQRDTAAAAAQLAVQHQQELDDAAKKYALDSAATTCTADKNVLSAQLTDAQKQNQILQDQLKKNTGGPGAPVWIGLGFVGGVVVTVVTAFAVSKATH